MVFIVLASVLLLSAYVAVEFGSYLGFNLYRYEMYPAFFLILIASVVLAQWLTNHGRLSNVLSSALQKRGLLAVIGVAAIVRIMFVMWSSIFPDEYWVIWALRSGPLE